MSEPQIEKILDQLHLELKQVMGDQLDAVILYGSRARGEARADSDIDVLVVVQGEVDYGGLVKRTSALVSNLSLENDVVISRAFVSKERFEQERSPFLLNVRREGIAHCG